MAAADRAGRTRLSLALVLETAVRLADEGGLDAVTMRRLARELGIEAMSLYHYVERRDDILDGMLDLVVGEFELPSADVGWKAALRGTAMSAHATLERHPWACALMTSAARVGPARMRYMEAMLGAFRRAGFSAAATDRAYHVLDGHIIGSALREAGYASAAAPQTSARTDAAADFLRRLPSGEYPNLAEHVQQHVAVTEAGEAAFEFGLDLILDGLERALATTSG